MILTFYYNMNVVGFLGYFQLWYQIEESSWFGYWYYWVLKIIFIGQLKINKILGYFSLHYEKQVNIMSVFSIEWKNNKQYLSTT